MSKTVLIVEDNELNLKLFCELLAAEGFRTITARDGASALAEARSGEPDLILMDIQLPEMSGIETARRIRADAGLGRSRTDRGLGRIPIIAVSAYPRRASRSRVADDFCDDYILKPVLPSALLNKVRRYLH